MWSPLMTNYFKWNVDGSSLGKPDPLGIGGVLRNHNGILLGIFSSPIGMLDSNVVELKAVVKAIELSGLTVACIINTLLLNLTQPMSLAG